MAIFLSILKFVWKYKLLFLILTLILTIGGQELRIRYLNSVLDKKKAELTIALDANKTNYETIKQMQAELSSAQSICDKRLKGKEAVIRNLKKIEELKPNGKDDSNDDILDSLNGMFNNP